MALATSSRTLLVVFGLSALLMWPARRPGVHAASWRDPSPHAVRFVSVDADVQVELLDWGGSGRPLILLAGGGDTAHVFDEFAPKLADGFHVYGLTRRGFGASGFSARVVDLDRLGKDVVAVIDRLKLTKPVLVGHSIAGAELSWMASRRPDLVAGLVYLEAAYPYAFDNGRGSTMDEFLAVTGPNPPKPGKSDLASFEALRNWDAREYGFRMPEAEFRQTWEATHDGRPFKPRDFPGSSAFTTIMTASEKFSSMPVPALVLFACPHVQEAWMRATPDAVVRKAADAQFAALDALAEKQAKAVADAARTSRIVRMRGMHFIFLSNEDDVLREMRAFLGALNASSR